MSARYVVLGCRPWSLRVFDEVIRGYPGIWTYVSHPQDLADELRRSVAPRYIFALHWSWRVPADIVESFECWGFYMTDLPYGRGGSPLQHLILGGASATRLTAFRLTDELDAGPVYLKSDLALDGCAEEIYTRATHIAANMIRQLIEQPVSPVPQTGTPVLFCRRTPEQSRLPGAGTLDEVYDFIRMLDAEGYPHAFLDCGSCRVEFRGARRAIDAVTATVRIVQHPVGDELQR